MNTVNTLIKWPGGKAGEIKYIEKLIPDFDRYIEPFFGGGAMFFFLQPRKAAVNDISGDLTGFYKLVKARNPVFHDCLCSYDALLNSLLAACEAHYDSIYAAYLSVKQGGAAAKRKPALRRLTDAIISGLPEESLKKLVLSRERFADRLDGGAADKMLRAARNEEKSPFSASDLRENLITGYTSGLYMYFRDVYNDILLKRAPTPGHEYNIANFYFIREYCYGSMFRYNAKGEFNIPYGGMSYNRKCFQSKIDSIFSERTAKLFSGTDIHCGDFEDFLEAVGPTENDFMFLDPPYDTDFSDYEGKAFTKEDQRRLAAALKKTKARFILIIKNTDFIHSLYEGSFRILCFDKTYTYNVRSRNDRSAEHLIITNLPENDAPCP